MTCGSCQIIQIISFILFRSKQFVIYVSFPNFKFCFGLDELNSIKIIFHSPRRSRLSTTIEFELRSKVHTSFCLCHSARMQNIIMGWLTHLWKSSQKLKDTIAPPPWLCDIFIVADKHIGNTLSKTQLTLHLLPMNLSRCSTTKSVFFKNSHLYV